MKSYIPIIASLFLVTTPFIPPANASETKIVAQAGEIKPYIKNNIAPQITVKISSAENGGSGVIIAQQGNTYLVLTNNHVLRDDKTFTIHTNDGATHQATEVTDGIQTEDDLALLQFSSNNSYQVADINSAATPKPEQTILATGYDAATGELITQEATIERADITLKDGYSIGYSSNIVQGMSGGAILNSDGELIGINGKSTFPIVNTGYVYQDDTQPTPEEIEELRQLNWGLTINSFLTQVNSDVITAYKLPQPETAPELGETELTGWLGELEAKAKQITVRIDSSSGANGSGVIIAKEGNTYTVLTADHVLCEKSKDTRECIDYEYTIITPDGEEQAIDVQTINAQPGVDLAVFKFVSNKTYQVAELADYPIQDSDAVFVVGFPRLSEKPEWQFSLGFGSEKEQGLINVNINSNNQSSDSSNFETSKSSLVDGYEMVYSSPTYGGMSGGAVLDKDGRVIGIHGLAEGETAINSQSGSEQEKKIHLGLSLGIPIKTFIGLADRLGIDATLSIQSNQPEEINFQESNDLQTAILGIKISDSNATPELQLERGNNLWRLRRYEEAVQAFDRAIAQKPEFIHLAYHGKGLALIYQAKWEEALASLELANSAQPQYDRAFAIKSVVLSGLNRFEEALLAIEKSIVLQPDNANWYSQKGSILSEWERYPEAENAFTKAIKIAPRNSYYNNRGLVYDKQGKIDLALSDLNQAIETNSKQAKIYFNRAKMYHEQGKISLALADYNQAITINPQFSNAFLERGVLFNDKGEIDLALADYNQAIKIDSDYASAYYNRGNLYQKQGKLELALADYNQAIKIDHQHDSAYYNRGVLYQKQGKLGLAFVDYNQAIKINPNNNADAYYNRGNFHYRQGKLGSALADYNQAIKIDPDYANAYNNRGLVYDNQEKIDLALADYNQAIAINPQLSDAYNNRGLAYINQGEIDLALADYNQAIQIDPENSEPYYNRGNLFYYQQEEEDLALADYNQAIRIDTQFARAFLNRGNLYYQRREMDLALADLNQAIAINPQFSNAYMGRGFIYHEQRKIDLALADYNTVLSIDVNSLVATTNIALIKYEMGVLSEARQRFEQVVYLDNKLAEPQLALAVTLFASGEIEKALGIAKKALLMDKKLSDTEYLQENIWGDKLIADTEILLSHPQMQAFLAQL